MVNKLRFGINPTPHPWRDVQKFGEWCVRAEELGYDAIFVPDHYNVPTPSFPSNDLVDAWTTLAYISAKTSKIKIGSLVSPIPRWIPSQLAKVIANVDFLSNGRVIAGFGVGFHPAEFINYSPSPYWDEDHLRVAKFVEGLQVILKLWTEDMVTFAGRYYTLKDAVLSPKPIQKPHPPLWSGGMGPLMLRITAKHLDGWVAHSAPSPHSIKSFEDYRTRVRTIQNYLREYGRDVGKFTFGFLLMIGLVIKDMKDSVEAIENYRKAGCQYFITEFTPPPPPHRYMELTEKFAEEIISTFV